MQDDLEPKAEKRDEAAPTLSPSNEGRTRRTAAVVRSVVSRRTPPQPESPTMQATAVSDHMPSPPRGEPDGTPLEFSPARFARARSEAHSEEALRKENARKALKQAQSIARKDGKCCADVQPSRRWDRPDAPKRVCGAEATRQGYCRKHYNRKVLKIRSRQQGYGGKCRPFADWQLPGNMSDAQHECLQGLPLSTSYDDCVTAMNAADPSNLLAPIYERPHK